MRRLGAWGLGVALLIGWGTAAGAADNPSDGGNAKPAARDNGGGGWFSRWFGTKNSVPAKPPEDKSREKDAETLKASAKLATGVDESATVRAREEAALLRRMAVCLKIKQIAEQNDDDRLYKVAEELDHRAFNIYLQRIANLPASRADVNLDEHLLEKHAGLEGARAATSSMSEPHTVPGDGPVANQGRED